MTDSVQKPLVEKWSQAYRESARADAPQWLRELRDRAAEEFARSGLPHRKDEAWKYTPVRALETLDPLIRTGQEAAPESIEFPGALIGAPDQRVDVANGVLASVTGESPAGVSLLPLHEGLQRFESRLRDRLDATSLQGSARAFAALNTAFLDQGLVIHVAESVQAGTVLIRWAFSPADTAFMNNFRLFVLLEPGASLSVVEQFESCEPGAHALNVMSDAELGEGAVLEQVRVVAESDQAVLLTSTSVEQQADSRYAYWGFDLGGSLVRHELNAELGGSAARASVNGAFVLDRKRHVDNHVSIEHRATDTRSQQFFRGVLGGRSRAVFNGRAMIAAGADGSSVEQSNANLLLSPAAEIDTKPELEIYADEVQASHGATVGQLDEDAVFYMRTRGLSDDLARRLLTSAFCRAVTDRIGDRELAERVADMLEDALPERLAASGED